MSEPYAPEQIESMRNTRPHPMAHIIDPRIVQFNAERRRWLATVDTLTADRDALRARVDEADAERDAALKVADVATDAAAKAVLDAKEVYEVRHLATIRDLRALLREARLRTSLGPPKMDGSSWGQRVDAALREGG